MIEYLCLDNDEAGKSGSQLLKVELSNLGTIEEFEYKYGNDPNSELILLKKNNTRKEVKDIVNR